MESRGSRKQMPCLSWRLYINPVGLLTVLIIYRILMESISLAAVLQDEHAARTIPFNAYEGMTPFVSTKKSFNISFNNSFGACLIIKDDNHLLAEWLAYHYHTLPLRRLIVGVDPFSETSPTAILDRYRRKGLMKITEWDEFNIMPPNHLSKHVTLKKTNYTEMKKLYVSRQRFFYAKCMAVLKLEGFSWTAFIDTDEYILPNSKVKDELRFNDTENQTIFEILSNPENQQIAPMIQEGCVSMARLQFGHKESNQSVVQSQVPTGFNGSHFSTLRWHYHIPAQSEKRAGKCMVNLLFAEDVDFLGSEVNAHRPNLRLCPRERRFLPLKRSPIIVHHYSGSWEQWNYRKDVRPVRQRENFDKLYFDDEDSKDDSIRPWLQDFVARHGYGLASYLLRGAGLLESTPDSAIPVMTHTPNHVSASTG